MNDIVIDSHVRLPVSQVKAKREDAIRKAFKAYADAYARVYIRRPVLLEVTAAGFARIDLPNMVVSAKRLAELTNMLKQRAKDL